MLAIERRNEILERLQSEKRVVVSELSDQYHVSEETIRRDLEKLEREGYATKSYGGAVINDNLGIDLPFNVRKKQNVEDKQKIADLAASFVEDGDHIFLDASSTAVFVALALKEKRQRLTVVTNSIEVLLVLTDLPDWDVISTGGTVDDRYLTLLGSGAEKTFDTYYADKMIFSCKALSYERGIVESKDAIGRIKKTMLSCSREKILAVDHSKFDQEAFIIVDDLRDVDTILTDRRPDEIWLRRFEETGTACIYPKE